MRAKEGTADMATIPEMKVKVEWEDGGERAIHSKFLLDWLESCGESWVEIIRCYDMFGNVYFRVKTCSRQHKAASRGSTLRDALQACVDQSKT
jgi:hypothetical protein